jgi:hypothetical protein
MFLNFNSLETSEVFVRISVIVTLGKFSGDTGLTDSRNSTNSFKPILV